MQGFFLGSLASSDAFSLLRAGEVYSTSLRGDLSNDDTRGLSDIEVTWMYSEPAVFSSSVGDL